MEAGLCRSVGLELRGYAGWWGRRNQEGSLEADNEDPSLAGRGAGRGDSAAAQSACSLCPGRENAFPLHSSLWVQDRPGGGVPGEGTVTPPSRWVLSRAAWQVATAEMLRCPTPPARPTLRGGAPPTSAPRVRGQRLCAGAGHAAGTRQVPTAHLYAVPGLRSGHPPVPLRP